MYIQTDPLVAGNWVSTLGRELKLSENCFPPSPSPSSGHQPHSWDREKCSICGNFYFSLHCETLETFPQEGLASEFSAEYRLHWGLCPQSSLLVSGTAFVLGMEPLLWLVSCVHGGCCPSLSEQLHYHLAVIFHFRSSSLFSDFLLY